MNNLSLRRSFAAFHITLGVVVFVESLRTAFAVSSGHDVNPLGSHLAILATIEAIAAILFLIPKTLKAGSALLLCIFVFAIIVHGISRELELLVYGVGVLFVSVHGSVFSRELFHSQKSAA
jgi:hypothetical protein